MQFLRFLLVGALNAAFSYALFAGLLWWNVEPAPALLVAYAIGILFNFFTTGRIVFRQTGYGALARFTLAYVVIYLFNLGLFNLVAGLGATPYVTQAACLPVVAVFSFLLFKFRVFRQPPVPRERPPRRERGARNSPEGPPVNVGDQG